MWRSGRSRTFGPTPSSAPARSSGRSLRSRRPRSARARRSRTSPTSATPRSERERTSPPATSPRTSSTSRDRARLGPGSAVTSERAWTMCSMPLSKWETMLGLRRGRSSQMMSPPARWRVSPLGRRQRKGGSTTSMESLTATEIALPGLEREIVTEPTQVHWLERAPQKRLMVVSGRSHRNLAEKIAGKLGCELGNVELETFADGETYVRFAESVRGADMFIVQTGSRPVDQNLVELLIMVNAAKLASAKRITAVIPWFFYARQDKKSRPREPITAKLVADMLQVAGVDRVLTMDLHAGQ